MLIFVLFLLVISLITNKAESDNVVFQEDDGTLLYAVLKANSSAYRKHIIKTLLPDKRFCGFQHTDDRFYNDTETALDEFPWLVHIRFSNMEYDQQYGDRCNGVLISNRYVLTDAYCGLESIKVKIGEYNTNETQSCVPGSQLEECSEPTVEIAVEEIIRDGDTTNGPYNFVLLRLVDKITFTDFIRPICLPLEPEKRPKDFKSLIFSGWGAADSRGIAKKRLHYDVVENQKCYDEEEWLQGNVKKAGVDFICTKPPQNITGVACNGDHGGPFMYSFSRKQQWYVEGVIVSVMKSQHGNPSLCGNVHPVNGIRITEKTINWIVASIRP